MNESREPQRDGVEPAAPEAHREAVEARLTAYALGQLDASDRAAVEMLLADPAAHEPRALVADTRAIAEALRAGGADDLPPRSPHLRRAVVAAGAAASGTVSPSRPAVPPRRAARRWLLALGGLAAALLIAFTVPTMTDQRPAATREVAHVAAPTPETAPPPPVAAPASKQRREAWAEPAAEVAAEAEVAAQVADEGAARDAVAAPAPTMRAPAPAAARPTGEMRSRRAAVEERAKGFHSPMADRGADDDVRPPVSRERYDQFADQPFRATADAPLSTFSIDVDTASYALVRRFLAAGRLPPPDAVRIEELINYFPYAYPQPEGDEPFSVTLEAAACPWREGHRLVRVGIQGRSIDRGQRPAGNLVFLVDVSGSMAAPDKLPLVKQALRMLVAELNADDHVTIVTYAGDAGLRLPPTSGAEQATIMAAIESLVPGGSTHGSAGITLAYEQAAERFIPGGSNRVILATDGDLNVGVTDNTALVELVQRQAAGGTFLTVLGFGQGNLQDEKLEAIADNGNGVYAYIDSAREARKVLVEQLTASTVTIAKDVKIQVEFNPAVVASYRLLGYENRALAAADFRDDRKDAGEIGAGHGVTAVYEIVLADESRDPARGAEPLKYQPEVAAAAARRAPPATDSVSRELLTVKLRSKRPDGDTSVLREVPLAERGGDFAAASADLRFAAAVAGFGMLLRNSPDRGDVTLADVARIAAAALGSDPGGHRAEFLDLVRKAEALRAGDR